MEGQGNEILVVFCGYIGYLHCSYHLLSFMVCGQLNYVSNY